MMPRVAFRQCDVERLLRAARAAGYEHPIVEKRPDGALRLLSEQPNTSAHNDGDDDLDAELEAWRREHGDS
jgi:hypothetical protein